MYPSGVPAFVKSICPGGLTPAGQSSAAGKAGQGLLRDSISAGVSRAAGLVTASALPSPAAGKANQSLVLEDFNGDGGLDTAQLAGNRILFQFFRADDTLLSTTSLPLTGVGSSILAADFNLDGKMDLALMRSGPSGSVVTILLGNGDGTFGPPTDYPAGASSFLPSYLDTGDFNGDGIPDLAVTNPPPAGSTVPGTVGVFIGKGDGTFAPQVTYPVGNFPGTIVAADFNGDGKTDLVALDSVRGLPVGANKVWVLLGNGDGTFRTAVSTPTGTAVGYLSFADLNHDGKLDLVIADEDASAMAIMRGNGDGTFQPTQKYLAASHPTITAPIPLGDGNTAIISPDSDDGGLTVVFVASDGTVHSPLLQTLGNNPAVITSADLNGDHHADLVITDPDTASLYVELGDGKGQFSAPVAYPLAQPQASGGLALGDVSRDGKIDAIVADAMGIEVLLGKGDGTFRSSQHVFGWRHAQIPGDRRFQLRWQTRCRGLESGGRWRFIVPG